MASLGSLLDALLELFIRLLDLDTAASLPDAPDWLKRRRKLIRIALIVLGIPAVPMLMLIFWKLFGG